METGLPISTPFELCGKTMPHSGGGGRWMIEVFWDLKWNFTPEKKNKIVFFSGGFYHSPPPWNQHIIHLWLCREHSRYHVGIWNSGTQVCSVPGWHPKRKRPTLPWGHMGIICSQVYVYSYLTWWNYELQAALSRDVFWEQNEFISPDDHQNEDYFCTKHEK